MNYQEAITTIQSQLNDRQPQRLEVPDFRPAAVVIPFFALENQPYILFTQRTDTVEHHKGQVSFPGGSRELQDQNLLATALRETEEEVGIPPEQVAIIGRLDDFPTISDFLVSPFVGTIPYPYPKNISTDEVAGLLEVPLSLFLSSEYFEVREREYNGKRYPVYYYYFGDTVIWGVTGYIINRFIDQVFGFNPAQNAEADTLKARAMLIKRKNR